MLNAFVAAAAEEVGHGGDSLRKSGHRGKAAERSRRFRAHDRAPWFLASARRVRNRSRSYAK